MLYQITDGTVSLGGQTILSHINFEIKGNEKIAVVGGNGAGKSTLLRLLAGELELDRDDKNPASRIFSAREIAIGMLHQNPKCPKSLTVGEYLMDEDDKNHGCYTKEHFYREAQSDRLLVELGLDKTDKKRLFEQMSGGEKTKIALIRLLMKQPDLLLLDEPTNHLDLQSVEWLEAYMKHYEGAVVFVSHDRFFLDQVADVVYELRAGQLQRYAGNYTAYRIQKRKNQDLQLKKYESQQAEIARLKELIEKFKNKPRKAAFARSRKTILERMEKIERPKEDDVHMFTGDIEPAVHGSKWVIEAEHLKIGYDKVLLELSCRMKRGQKIGIIGDNGTGKTTFLKTVAGMLEPLSGSITLGNHTVMGYFDQQTAAITSPLSVREHFSRLYPAMTEKEVRQTLGAYLFGKQDVGKCVSDLSGGEKARLILCELMTGRPNLFVLDEPTNHMDISAKETLESAFCAYKGTLLFASHDRYFVNKVADALLIFQGNQVLYYPFGYEHYLSKMRRSTGDDIAAMIQAEDQALIADLKAVPKAERHRLKEIGTEEAHADWKLSLAEEPLLVQQEKTEAAYDAYLAAFLHYREELLRGWKEAAVIGDEQIIPDVLHPAGIMNGQAKEQVSSQDRNLEDTVDELYREYEQENDKLTELCLQWYDVYQEFYQEK